MAQPVVSLLGDRQVCPSTTDSETSYQIDLAPSFGARQDTLSVTSCQTTSYQTDESSEPTYEELQSIKEHMIGKARRKRKLNIPFLDLPSPPSSTSSGSVTPTADEERSSTRSVLSTPHQDLSSSLSNYTCDSFESVSTGARRKQYPTTTEGNQ